MDKSKRNSLVGSTKGQSKSAKYFRKNKLAKAKKDAYNKEYHASPERKKYRAALNKANRQMGSKKNDGKDLSHTSDGKLVKEAQSKNRARNNKGNNGRLKPATKKK